MEERSLVCPKLIRFSLSSKLLKQELPHNSRGMLFLPKRMTTHLRNQLLRRLLNRQLVLQLLKQL
jgi:hypothetical protein